MTDDKPLSTAGFGGTELPPPNIDDAISPIMDEKGLLLIDKGPTTMDDEGTGEFGEPRTDWGTTETGDEKAPTF